MDFKLWMLFFVPEIGILLLILIQMILDHRSKNHSKSDSIATKISHGDLYGSSYQFQKVFEDFNDLKDSRNPK